MFVSVGCVHLSVGGVHISVGGCVGAFVSGQCVPVSVYGGRERVFVRREYVRAFVGGWCVCVYMWRLLSCVSRWSTCVYS